MKVKYADGGKFLMNSEKKFQDMAGAGSGINMAYADRGRPFGGKLRKLNALHYLGGGDKGRAIRQEKRYLKKLERQGKLNEYGTQSQDRLDYLKSLQKHRAKKAAAGVGAAAALGAGIAFGPAAVGALKAKGAAKLAAKGIGSATKGTFGSNAFGLKPGLGMPGGAGLNYNLPQSLQTLSGEGGLGLSPFQRNQFQAGMNYFGQGQGSGQTSLGKGYGLGQFLGNAVRGYNAADPRLQTPQQQFTVDTDGDGILDAESGIRLNKRGKRRGMDLGALAMLLNQAQQARDVGNLKMRLRKSAPRRRGSSAAGRFFSKRAR